MSASPNGTPKAPAVRPPLYFVNGFTDFLFIGGLSIVALVTARLYFTPVTDPNMYSVALALAWVCNWPHFAASTYRLYESRDNIRQYPMTALVIPWLILAGVVASFLSPQVIAPVWVKMFLLWSPYHFSGQTFGISMIYARRAGYLIGRWQRLSLSMFIYATFISLTVRTDIGDKTDEYYTIQCPRLGLPEWRLPGHEQYLLVEIAQVFMYACAVVFLGFAIYRWVKFRQRPPLILFLPALAQFCWFVTGPSRNSFFEFVPFFHSLQYLFIAWAVRLKGQLDRGGATPSVRFVLGESLVWAITIFLGGIMLFLLLPRVGFWLGGLSVAVAGGILTAGVQIHHFFVDGVIWKLRTKSVSSPLMVNLDQLVRPAGPPVLPPAPARVPVGVGAGYG
jgi:hypothetical protein